MKKMLYLSLFVVTAFAFAGCTPPATNTNTVTNTNTNTAPKAAAPTADSLMALENKAWEAWKNKDGKYFEGFLADMPMISGSGEGTMPKAEVVKMIAENKDDVKSFSLSDPHVTPVGADAAVLTYKGTVDGTSDGKAIPSPVTVATVFVRVGADWKAVYHNEVPIIDPKAAPSAEKKDGDMKPSAPAENKEAPATKPAAAADSNKPMAPANSNAAASNSNSTASSTDATLTAALMAEEQKGWEGWKAKDAKALEAVTAKDFAFIDAMGQGKFTKADVMKLWTTDNNCTVSSVSLSDGKAVSIGKDTAILVVKGTAVGTCGEVKLEPLWNTTVFVKEGDVWKAAYIFETPVKKS